MTVAEWDQAMAINLRGSFIATKSALPYLKQSKCGRVILTSSITGPLTGNPGFSHYGASKAGLLGFMRSAAVEFGKYHITINALLPGYILDAATATLGNHILNLTQSIVPLG